MFIFCAGNELFFVALYLMKWDHTPASNYLPFLSVIPWLAPRTLAELLAASTFLVCALKNFINAVQLWKARCVLIFRSIPELMPITLGSKILVGVDLAEREQKRRLEARAAQTKSN